MTDREMLEFAAKAAGIVGNWIDRKRMVRDFVFIREYGFKTSLGLWNPLDDDGDALRLAVKLSMSLGKVVTSRGCAWIVDHRYESVIDSDSLSSARKAITSAAAEIGKRMP